MHKIQSQQSQQKEKIIKIREETEERSKKTREKINKGKSCIFEKISKIDKPLGRFIKKKREDPNKQIKK